MEVVKVMSKVGELREGDLLDKHVVSGTEADDLGVNILKGLDSYLEDIDDRLTISRMVSDSVIKGMVEAIEKMAEEKITAKESEIAWMKSKMCFVESGDEESETTTEISNDRGELDSLLKASLEETGRFQQLGGQISERINEIMDVKKKLNSILKSLPGSEFGLISHGSGDMDHLNNKLFSSHVSTSSSFWVENGDSEVSKNGMPETWDIAQLNHLDIDGLVTHFNSIITKMKRDHESQVQKMTEDYFSLKREYFKEKGFSLPPRKDKDLEIVRKRIPEVMVKLDDILEENEKMLKFSKDTRTITSLKDKVDGLLLENHQLRKLLSNKKKEISKLTLQVSSVEGNFKKLMGDLESAAEDADIEVFLHQEVYGCLLRELTLYESSKSEELAVVFVGTEDAKATKECDIEDSDVELLITQGISEVMFRESVMESKVIIDGMIKKYLDECAKRTTFHSKSLERERELKLLTEEQESLKQKVDSLEAALEEKVELVEELTTELEKERNQCEIASCQIDKLKSHVACLQSSLDSRDGEVDVIKGKLVEALNQVEVSKLERNKVKREFERMSEKLSVANKERHTFHAMAQKNQVDMEILESAKNEQNKLMQSVIGLIMRLSRGFAEFESKVAEDIKWKSLRLEKNNSLMPSLLKKNNILRRSLSIYKQKLERKCADLQTAETEVDLLGDQVETLFNLLEKIYIALDHYSPILQHYPGIVEVLKLIRRELNGESLKLKGLVC